MTAGSRARGALFALLALFTLHAATVSEVRAQRVSLWLDATASTTTPTGAGGGDAAYGMFGARMEAQLSQSVRVHANAQAGGGTRSEDGRWLYGEASTMLQRRAGPVRLLLDGSGFALHYTEPLTYGAHALRVQPGLAIPLGGARLSARADVLRGAWSSGEASDALPGLPGLPGASKETGELRVDGGELTLGLGRGRLGLELGAHAHEAVNGVRDGSYTGARAAAALAIGRVDLFAGVDAQRSPADDELGYHAGVVATLSERVQAVGVLSKPVTDMVYGTRNGLGLSLGASLLVGGGEGARPTRLATIGPVSGARRSVRITLERADLPSVAVAGSFNAWVPVAMKRTGDVWTIALSLEPGTYQFAFQLSDGTWFVPDDAQGIVNDGFGQRNATLVVPPV